VPSKLTDETGTQITTKPPAKRITTTTAILDAIKIKLPELQPVPTEKSCTTTVTLAAFRSYPAQNNKHK